VLAAHCIDVSMTWHEVEVLPFTDPVTGR
jgi:hypothetical protein